MSQKFMAITCEKVMSENITTIVTTHNLNDALKYGNRLIALKAGKIFLDITPDDKKKLTKEDLLSIYS